MSVQYVKLGDVCAKDSSNIAQKDLKDCFGKYPVYGAGGYIQNVDFYHQEDEYIAIVKDGAGVGRAMILPAKSSVIGTMQYIIPDKNKVDMHYLYYAIINMALGKYFSGATIPHIYFKDYQKEIFKLPDLETQKKIADNLKNIDLIIAKKNKQIGLFNELVKSRFIEMFGDPLLNPYNLITVKLGTVLAVEPQNGLYKPQSDYVVDKSGIPILRIDSFYNGQLRNLNSLKRLNCSDIEKKRYLLKENDIVINRVNSIEYLGKCALITGLVEDTLFESNMMRLHVDETKYNPVYVTYLLCSKFIYNQILSMAKKAVNQASINQKDVENFEIYMPNLNLQNKFADFVKQTDKSKLEIQKSLDKLEILKKSLMQQYFG